MKINWDRTNESNFDMHGQLSLYFDIEDFDFYLSFGSGYALYLIVDAYPSVPKRHYIDTLETREDAQQLAQLLIDNNLQAWE